LSPNVLTSREWYMRSSSLCRC